MAKVYLGKIVGLHGLKGELKLISDFEYKTKVFVKDFPLMIKENTYLLDSSRPHKKYDLLKLKGYEDLNEVQDLINEEVFINYEDLNLKDNEYILQELIGAQVIDNHKFIGWITNIIKSSKYNYVKIDQKFLIPLISEFVISYDKKAKILYTKRAKELQKI